MSGDELKYFSPWDEVARSRNHLPHWQQSGATYFVTWRLEDSLPTEMLAQFREDRQLWMDQHPEPWTPADEAEYHQLFSARIDEWLDAGHGECLLSKLANAEFVMEGLQFFEGERTRLVSAVVMPNHVHVLFGLSPEWKLEQLVHSWKRQSAKKVNALEGRRGRLWQKDYFDRLIRDQKHFENCVRYIRRNPEKARLSEGEYLLFESDPAKQVPSRSGGFQPPG
tara:strand:- start:1020 stop:1691 length:672 start_codon:yes stop_codon:yes gene_type:complete